MENQIPEQKHGYGKRPLWQWFVLYLVIGVIVYGLVYYFVIAKHGGYSYNTSSNYASNSQTVYSSPTAIPVTTNLQNIVKTRTDSAKGTYLTDFQDVTLYIYDQDKPGTSNCVNACASAWPPYMSGATAQSVMPTNISIVKRSDSSLQFAWKGMPLYYYAKDQKPGDAMGNGIGGVWHIVSRP